MLPEKTWKNISKHLETLNTRAVSLSSPIISWLMLYHRFSMLECDKLCLCSEMSSQGPVPSKPWHEASSTATTCLPCCLPCCRQGSLSSCKRRADSRFSWNSSTTIRERLRLPYGWCWCMLMSLMSCAPENPPQSPKALRQHRTKKKTPQLPQRFAKSDISKDCAESVSNTSCSVPILQRLEGTGSKANQKLQDSLKESTRNHD